MKNIHTQITKKNNNNNKENVLGKEKKRTNKNMNKAYTHS